MVDGKSGATSLSWVNPTAPESCVAGMTSSLSGKSPIWDRRPFIQLFGPTLG
jgi:hypothetical protein